MGESTTVVTTKSTLLNISPPSSSVRQGMNPPDCQVLPVNPQSHQQTTLPQQIRVKGYLPVAAKGNSSSNNNNTNTNTNHNHIDKTSGDTSFAKQSTSMTISTSHDATLDCSTITSSSSDTCTTLASSSGGDVDDTSKVGANVNLTSQPSIANTSNDTCNNTTTSNATATTISTSNDTSGKCTSVPAVSVCNFVVPGDKEFEGDTESTPSSDVDVDDDQQMFPPESIDDGKSSSGVSSQMTWPLTTTSSTHSHMDLGSEDDEDAYEGGVEDDEDEDDEDEDEDDLDEYSDDYYLSDGSYYSSSKSPTSLAPAAKSSCKSRSNCQRLRKKHTISDFFYSPSTINNNVVINGKQVDMSSKRYAVLTYDQVVRLDRVMDTVIPIHGRGNFPTLEVKLKDLVQVVRSKLQNDCVELRDIRLNGGAASYVLSSSDSNSHSYTDLDLIFGVDLANNRNFDKVRTAVLDSLLHFLPSGVNRNKMNSCTLKEAYVHKMVKVTEGSDRWSLISLCNNNGRDIEIKFVDSMKRQFEFSVDSFQIILDSLLLYYECSSSTVSSDGAAKSPVDSCIDSDDSSSCSFHVESAISSDCEGTKSASDEDDECLGDEKSIAAKLSNASSRATSNSLKGHHSSPTSTRSSATKMSENIYPTVVGESIYGNFSEALNHLHKKLIATRNPEEIRGGGLLKYCRLQVLGYTPARWDEIKNLEKYMCSRFFIDFPDVSVQRVKLANYLNSHFHDDQTKHDYLMILHKVVDESTVCLMGHERRQTLALIEEFAYHFYFQDQHRNHPHHPHHYSAHASLHHSLTNSNQPTTPMHHLHPATTQYHMIRSNSFSSPPQHPHQNQHQHQHQHQQQQSQHHHQHQHQQSTYSPPLELSPCQVTFHQHNISPQSNSHQANTSSATHSTHHNHHQQQQQQQQQHHQLQHQQSQQQQQQQQQQPASQEMQTNVPELNSSSPQSHTTLLVTSSGHYYYTPYPHSSYPGAISTMATGPSHHHQGQMSPAHHHNHPHHHAHHHAHPHHGLNHVHQANSPYPCYNCHCCLGQWMHCM